MHACMYVHLCYTYHKQKKHNGHAVGPYKLFMWTLGQLYKKKDCHLSFIISCLFLIFIQFDCVQFCLLCLLAIVSHI